MDGFSSTSDKRVSKTQVSVSDKKAYFLFLLFIVLKKNDLISKCMSPANSQQAEQCVSVQQYANFRKPPLSEMTHCSKGYALDMTFG